MTYILFETSENKKVAKNQRLKVFVNSAADKSNFHVEYLQLTNFEQEQYYYL